MDGRGLRNKEKIHPLSGKCTQVLVFFIYFINIIIWYICFASLRNTDVNYSCS